MVKAECPKCRCFSTSRCDEQKPDGTFGPGKTWRCNECKHTFEGLTSDQVNRIVDCFPDRMRTIAEACSRWDDTTMITASEVTTSDDTTPPPITADKIAQYRNETGASMMDAKRVLNARRDSKIIEELLEQGTMYAKVDWLLRREKAKIDETLNRYR